MCGILLSLLYKSLQTEMLTFKLREKLKKNYNRLTDTCNSKLCVCELWQYLHVCALKFNWVKPWFSQITPYFVLYQSYFIEPVDIFNTAGKTLTKGLHT